MTVFPSEARNLPRRDLGDDFRALPNDRTGGPASLRFGRHKILCAGRGYLSFPFASCRRKGREVRYFRSTIPVMPTNLRRFYGEGHLHYLTCSCCPSKCSNRPPSGNPVSTTSTSGVTRSTSRSCATCIAIRWHEVWSNNRIIGDGAASGSSPTRSPGLCAWISKCPTQNLNP